MPIMPLIETLGVAESESGGADYGRMRLWGSLSFIAGSVGGGAILAATSSGIVIWLLIASFAALLAGAIALPREPRTIGVETAEPVRAGAVVALAMQPLFIAFVVGAGLIQAGHAVYYGFGTVHWQSTGLTANTIGMLWSVGVLAEIVLFLYGRRAVELCGPALLIVIGGVAGIIRWSVTSAEPGLAMLIAVQAIHGLTFGATHLGSILFIARATPARLQASAQGAYAAVSGGLIMAAVMSASGPLYAALGSGAYLAMAGVSALGAAFGAVVLIVWNGRRLTP